MRSYTMAFALAVIAAAAPARSQGTSASNILPGCQSSLSLYDAAEPFIRGVCIGEVTGVRDAAISAGLVCESGETTIQQYIRVVIRYIKEQPDRLNERFTTLALEALQNVWPCGEGNDSQVRSRSDADDVVTHLGDEAVIGGDEPPRNDSVRRVRRPPPVKRHRDHSGDVRP